MTGFRTSPEALGQAAGQAAGQAEAIDACVAPVVAALDTCRSALMDFTASDAIGAFADAWRTNVGELARIADQAGLNLHDNAVTYARAETDNTGRFRSVDPG